MSMLFDFHPPAPRLLSGLAVLLLLILVACNDTPPATPQPTPASPAAPTTAPTAVSATSKPASRTPQAEVPTVAGYALRVTRGGQVLKAFTADKLNALPQQLLEIGGRPMAGTPLRQLLAAAGVTTAQQLTITGTDVQRSGPATVTLAWTAVIDDVYLGVNKRGAGKLFGPNLPEAQWVVDVTEIAVAP